MGLPKIDTRWHTVANGLDPDVTPTSGERRNEWLEVGSECAVVHGATTLRVRALTGLEVHAIERGTDANAVERWLAHMARAAVHPDDRAFYDAELPWQFQFALGVLVSAWSSPKPDPITAPA
jgi:hypothetical protein